MTRQRPPAVRLAAWACCLTLACCSSEAFEPNDLGGPLIPPDLWAPPPALPAAPYQPCAPLAAPMMKLRRVMLAGVWLDPHGYVLAAKEEAQAWVRKRLRLGVLADPRGTLQGTLRNIDLLAARFARARVDAVILLGGIAHGGADQRRIVQRLTHALEVPLLVLAGDLAAIDELRGTLALVGSRVVDLSLARALRHPAATLLSLPGVAHAAQLVAGGGGCAFSAAELAGLEALARQSPRPRVLLAYTPPRGVGEQAIDSSLAAVNSGSVAVRALMERADIHFGVFAQINEAGGRATTRAGSPLDEHTWSTSLLLNVGSVEAIPKRATDAQWRHGMGAIVELRDGRARYRLVELPKATASMLEPDVPPAGPL